MAGLFEYIEEHKEEIEAEILENERKRKRQEEEERQRAERLEAEQAELEAQQEAEEKRKEVKAQRTQEEKNRKKEQGALAYKEYQRNIIASEALRVEFLGELKRQEEPKKIIETAAECIAAATNDPTFLEQVREYLKAY